MFMQETLTRASDVTLDPRLHVLECAKADVAPGPDGVQGCPGRGGIEMGSKGEV